jgi:hypothetical protein
MAHPSARLENCIIYMDRAAVLENRHKELKNLRVAVENGVILRLHKPQVLL